MNPALNEKLQVDFMYVGTKREIRDILNGMDLGTKYAERTLKKSKEEEEINQDFESRLYYKSSAPKRISADYEFCHPIMQLFLTL